MHKKSAYGYNIFKPADRHKNERKYFFMETRKNPCINCTVSQCQYNMVSENYCVLDSIHVGTHEKNPTVPECTDCNSFVKRSCACDTADGCKL